MSDIHSLAVFVESEAPNFDSAGLFETLQKVAVGKVWNFLTGAYIFRSRMSDREVSRLLHNDYFPTHIVLDFDPAQSSGVLPQGAWNSYFLDIFYDDLERIGDFKGWDKETIEKVKKSHRGNV